MIKRYAFMMGIALCGAVMYGASNQEIFLRGNKAYKEGAYQEALECYEQIPQKGNAVWHNMGNCYYQLQRPVDACVHWQRAQRYAGYDDYCTLNTQMALLDAEDIVDTTVKNQEGWLFWLRARTASYSLLAIQLIAILFWFSLFIAMRVRAHWSAILLLLISSIFLVWVSIDMQTQRCRVYAVTIEEAPVYVGPNLAYHQQGVVKHARSVILTDEREGWYKIAYKGLAGWVQADKLVKV